MGWLKWVVGAFIVLGVSANILKNDREANNESTPVELVEKAKSDGSSSSDSTPSQPQPQSQSNFVNLVETYSSRFGGAKNELQESIMRDERRGAILDVLESGLSVANWQGTISQLETNMEGKAILSVRVSPNVVLKTWNNALSDIFDNTLIDKNSPSYLALIELSVGDNVLFSGNFLSSDEDGVKETSITTGGSMQEPEFLFKFNKIMKE
jgi:hypothetical protein